jgi:hypothetical protein
MRASVQSAPRLPTTCSISLDVTRLLTEGGSSITVDYLTDQVLKKIRQENDSVMKRTKLGYERIESASEVKAK